MKVTRPIHPFFLLFYTIESPSSFTTSPIYLVRLAFCRGGGVGRVPNRMGALQEHERWSGWPGASLQAVPPLSRRLLRFFSVLSFLFFFIRASIHPPCLLHAARLLPPPTSFIHLF